MTIIYQEELASGGNLVNIVEIYLLLLWIDEFLDILSFNSTFKKRTALKHYFKPMVLLP